MKLVRTAASRHADMAAIRAALADEPAPIAAVRADLQRDGWRGPALHQACAAVHRAARDTQVVESHFVT